MPLKMSPCHAWEVSMKCRNNEQNLLRITLCCCWRWVGKCRAGWSFPAAEVPHNNRWAAALNSPGKWQWQCMLLFSLLYICCFQEDWAKCSITVFVRWPLHGCPNFTHQQYPLCPYMKDPFPRSQSEGLGKALSWDSEERWGAALREYYILTLVRPCQKWVEMYVTLHTNKIPLLGAEYHQHNTSHTTAYIVMKAMIWFL